MGGRAARGFAAVLLFVLFAGEALRNTLSWYGFAVVVGALAIACAVVLFRLRRAAPRGGRPSVSALLVDPALPLTAFLVWACLSAVWSAYPGGTLLGSAVIVATTLAPLVIRRLLGWDDIVVALWRALAAIVAASLVFEVAVALVGRPVLPVFPIDVSPGEKVPLAFYWSRAQLFDGGPIQGILGNANLLGFVALLLLCVSAALLRRRDAPPRPLLLAGAAAGAATLVLARSSTIVVSAIVVLAVVGCAALLRRRRTRALGWGLIGVLLVGAAGAVLAADRVVALLGRSSDLTGRTDIWATVAGLFVQRPVAGWGWTGYWQPWIPLFDGLAERRGVVYLQAHNALLDTAFQLGVIGAGLLVWLLALVVVRAARASTTSLLPLALITALLVQSLTESRLLYEGNWALLVLLSLHLSAVARPVTPAGRSSVSGAGSFAARRRGR